MNKVYIVFPENALDMMPIQNSKAAGCFTPFPFPSHAKEY